MVGAPSPALPPPVTYDIENWEELDVYTAANRAGHFLGQKGFLLIKGTIPHTVKLEVEREARLFRKAGDLDRLSLEASSCFFGELCSAWARELSDPKDEAPASETGLRKVEQVLQGIGHAIGNASEQYFNTEIIGYTRGMLHHSLLPDDPIPPELEDDEEASVIAGRAQRRRVGLLYFLGPSTAVMSITPREDAKRTYEVVLRGACIVAFRSDVCSVRVQTRGYALAVHVDFLARVRAGLQEGRKDWLPPPEELQLWYERRYAVVVNDMPDDDDTVPWDIMKQAKLTFYNNELVRIVQFHVDLPTLAFSGGDTNPIEATFLCGQDVVTEIVSPSAVNGTDLAGGSVAHFAAKWELEEWYDADRDNAVNFKMYTRHLSVLNRGHDPANDYNPAQFGIPNMENFTVDRRSRMVVESQSVCLTNSNFLPEDTRGQDIGLYVGLSGQNQYDNFATKPKLVNKYAWTNMSNASMVSRMSYALGSSGPCLAVDTEDSSGMTAFNTAVSSVRRRDCGPFALVSSASFTGNPMDVVMLCAASQISQTGRSMVFDTSCDGFVKGEGVVTMLLEPHDAPTRKEKQGKPNEYKKPWEPVGIRGLVTGIAMNAKGQSASLTAPSGPALIALMDKASRDAGIQAHLLDAVEVNAGGHQLEDMVELGTILQRLGHKERDLPAVPLRAIKSIYGNLGPPSGLASLVRTCFFLEAALHGPSIHMHQLLDMSDLLQDNSMGGESRYLILSEAVEAKDWAQFVGVSSFGMTGTNGHTILWGNKAEAKTKKKLVNKPISFWPVGAGKEAKPPLRGYFVVGTWVAWEPDCTGMMQREAPGVYGYTLVMGENNRESFQIWVDEDSEQVLHPLERDAVSDVAVRGPDTDIERALCWTINGTVSTVRLINEAQAQQLKATEEQAQQPSPPTAAPLQHDDEYPTMVAFLQDWAPEDHDGKGPISGMPLARMGAADEGQPGDRYRIRLHVCGNYKRVEWAKLLSTDRYYGEVEEMKYKHNYQVVGDHNYWTFEKMESPEEGLYIAEVRLLKEVSCFQIFRDGDWDQGMHPAVSDSYPTGAVQGPSDMGQGKKWRITGKVGDSFRVQLSRRRNEEEERDEKSITCEFVRNEPVDFVKLAEQHKYYLVGSWTGFEKAQEMEKDAETGNFQQEVTLGKTGMAQFQILLNSNYLASVHPDVSDASMHDASHVLMGPDDDGAGMYWTIGLHPNDTFAEGNHVMVHLVMLDGRPHRVWWERYHSPMEHQEQILRGALRTFDRHAKLLGFEPYAPPDIPPKRTSMPRYLNGKPVDWGRGEPSSLPTAAG